MTLATYSDLVAEVRQQLARSDVDGRIPQAIAAVEASLNRQLRTLDMEQVSLLTTSAGVGEVALPAGWRELRDVSHASAGGTLEQLSLKRLLQRQWVEGPGRPRWFAIRGDVLMLGPVPDADYGLVVSYFEPIPALTAAQPSNWLMLRHPDLYLYGVLVRIAVALADERMVVQFQQRFEQVLWEVSQEDRSRRMGQGDLAMQPVRGV
jgi:hypothetical protein